MTKAGGLGGSLSSAAVLRPDALLGIDIGTSNCRAIAFDLDGRRILARSASVPAAHAADGRVALDADHVWNVVGDLIREVAGSVRVVGVGVCAQLATVLVDDEGRPTHEVMPWSDRRATDDARLLAGTMGESAARIGRRKVTAESTAVRLSWLARHEPAVIDRTSQVISLKDYVVARLTGKILTDVTNASFTLLFDVAQRTWSDELLAATGVRRELLPMAREASEAAGVVSQAGSMTGLSPGIPVAVGGPDGSVAVLGAGGAAAGGVVDVAGSTDVLYAIVDQPPVRYDADLIVNAFVLPGIWAVGGPTGMTGGAIAWLAGLLGYHTTDDLHSVLDDAASQVAPGCEGLSFRTSLTGERYPSWNASAAGLLSGLRPHHQARHLLRAAQEGGAFLVAEGLDALSAAGIPNDGIAVVGGAAGRADALQLRADIWGRPVLAVVERDASALGSAILAGLAAGLFGTPRDALDRMVHIDREFLPRRDVAAAYGEARARWRAAGR